MEFTKCNLVLKNCSECLLCISEFTQKTGRLQGVVVNKHGELGLREWLCWSHTYRAFAARNAAVLRAVEYQGQH